VNSLQIILDQPVDEGKLIEDLQSRFPLFASEMIKISFENQDKKRILVINTTKVALEKICSVIKQHKVIEQHNPINKNIEEVKSMTKPASGFLGTMTLAIEELDKEIKQQLVMIGETAKEAKQQIAKVVEDVNVESKEKIKALTQKVEKFITDHENKVTLTISNVEKKSGIEFADLRKKIDEIKGIIDTQGNTLDAKLKEIVRLFGEMSKALQ